MTNEVCATTHKVCAMTHEVCATETEGLRTENNNLRNENHKLRNVVQDTNQKLNRLISMQMEAAHPASSHPTDEPSSQPVPPLLLPSKPLDLEALFSLYLIAAAPGLKPLRLLRARLHCRTPLPHTTAAHHCRTPLPHTTH